MIHLKALRTKGTVWAAGALMLFALVSCGGASSSSRAKQGQMDTPKYHTGMGDEALDKGNYEDAYRAYKSAVGLDGNYSQALSGLAVSNAYRAASPNVSPKTKGEVLVLAEELIEKAIDKAESKESKARAHNFAIRVYYVLQLPSDQWYETAQKHFKETLDLAPNNPESYYFMAMAESTKLNYDQASSHLKKVLGIQGKYEAEANKELERIQQVQRALPGSQFGDKIANEKEISRADVAALFMAELRLDKLYENRTKDMASSFSAPDSQEKMQLDPVQQYPDAVDISGHPMQKTILDVIRLGIKGLEPDAAHKFHPDQKLTRSEFALMVQDIMVKVIKDDSLETKFIGQDSVFPDVRGDEWFYNASRVVVSRGLLTVSDKVTGAFNPTGPVSGADALLTIRNLKEILKSYLR
ncbi:MAG: hypothetical protein OEY59_07970 [Deltaproteobacteria bacterium]|nr:hypothetical protein [Deltaproteobacteria bacterium]